MAHSYRSATSLAATPLNLTLTCKLGQVRPLLRGVVVGLVAGGVGTVSGDGLVVEIRRVPAQLGGKFSTQALVMVATGHLRLVLVVDHFDGADLNRLGQVVVEGEGAVSPGLWRQISGLGL